MHRQGYIAERWVVNRAIVFVRPSRIRKNALDSLSDFLTCLLLADDSGQASCDFRRALGKIFPDVIQHLRAIVRSSPGPTIRFARGLHRVANILAIAERGLT